ncbi:MAG: hydantoinase/oxoprolinase family protein [Gammaproteobacteria bacterium]|jgi:N-methylhydantoinase A|tara:strand:- start:2476 stop:4509 length:2034 start_codon:yes stop_codon:yes gene_type:complete
MWRVGIDVGGTFTDLFAWDEQDNRQISSKVLTTKPDRSLGVMNALKEAGIEARDVSHLMHGTTTATNALITRDYPEVAMVTTNGFRDTIEIGRQHRAELYNPYQTKPRPIIKRRYRYTLDERIDVNGEVVRPLDLQAARNIAKKIRIHDIQSVAVAFINSYVSARHEDKMRDIILEENPDIYCITSSDTRALFREHGRFVTAAIRAATMPVMEQYFGHLEASLESAGFHGRLMILKSSGGITGVGYAKDHPEELIESGPAGGVAYAAYLNEVKGDCPNIIHTDVGGTSFDVSIVENGKGLVTRDHEIEWEVPVIVPMLDIHSVGAGGGSIGWVDDGNSLRVGPQSAGSSPGPASYGLGGTEPTITDANLLLGRIEPSLGGKMMLDVAAAEAAVSKVGERVGLSTIEAADGMVRIGCENMAQAVKKVITGRGRDPRDFILASFGGAGAMHAFLIAESINVPKIIVPAAAGVASAFGATAMDLRHDLEAFYFSAVVDANVGLMNELYDKLESDALALLAADGVSEADVIVTRTAQMRYVGQSYEVETPVPEGVLDENDLSELSQRFHQCHKQEFGVSSDDFEPSIVVLGLAAVGKTKRPPAVMVAASGNDAKKGVRDVYFDRQWHESVVYDGHALGPQSEVVGPCIVEFEHACAVIPPYAVGTVDDYGNMIIELNKVTK